MSIVKTSASLPIGLANPNERAIAETELYARAWLSRAVDAQQGAGADNTRNFLRIATFPDPCSTRADIEYMANVDFDST